MTIDIIFDMLTLGKVGIFQKESVSIEIKSSNVEKN